MAEPRFRKFKGCFMKTPLTQNLTLISRLYSIKIRYRAFSDSIIVRNPYFGVLASGLIFSFALFD